MKPKNETVVLDFVPELQEALEKIEKAVYIPMGFGELTITSGKDGEHHGKPVKGDKLDPHYMGKAADVRTRMIPFQQRQTVLETIQEVVGPAFVVLWENRGKDADHYHVQYGHIA